MSAFGSSSSSGDISGRALNRVQKELEKFNQAKEANEAEGLRIEELSAKQWHVHLRGAEGTIYAGEEYILRVTFNNDYPMDSPEILFLEPAPVHPHVYSNGHICLNILYEDCVTVKALPEDNARYVSRPRGNPKLTRFVYHDDTV